jgi:hypothetical protein
MAVAVSFDVPRTTPMAEKTKNKRLMFGEDRAEYDSRNRSREFCRAGSDPRKLGGLNVRSKVSKST